MSQRLSETIREKESLQKQLNDLERQVQTIQKEIARRQDLTIPSDEELEVDESAGPANNIDDEGMSASMRVSSQGKGVDKVSWSERYMSRLEDDSTIDTGT